MSHRIAALAAALLAPIGIGFAAPVVLHSSGVQVAQAGEDPPDAAPDPAASPVPAPPAPVVTPVATPVPTPTVAPPVLRPLPPKPKDTLQDSPPPAQPKTDTGGRRAGDETQPRATARPAAPVVVLPASVPQTSTVGSSSTQSTLGDTGAIPQGGVQAGGGGTARRRGHRAG
jgi:hypothetical protein